MSQIKPFLLVICDGFGYSTATQYNAIAHANIPNFDTLWAQYPHTVLTAAGAPIGLLPNAPGNSEVGHQAIGTGRITIQPVTQLLDAIKNRTFFSNPILTKGLASLVHNKGRLHIIGLLSDTGIHSHEAIAEAVVKAASMEEVTQIYLHLFLDGRDTAPRTAAQYLKKIDALIDTYPNVTLASIAGRFYGMDRDGNWDRTKKSYRVLTQVEPCKYSSWESALEHYYAQDITDEFIPPTQLAAAGIVQPHDGIFFFNTRPDRARQLTQAFIAPNFTHFMRTKIPLSCFITPVTYGLPTSVMYPPHHQENTLVDILLTHHKAVYEIAETEKYAHVSYFFNGGREQEKPGETRVLIDSLRLKTYESNPCMSAPIITRAVLESLEHTPKDFYVINYANADMVGHSGNFDATIQAVECLDQQIGILYEYAVKKLHGSMIITADHGNAEEMFDISTNQPKTAHTANKVPFIFVSPEKSGIGLSSLTSLTDIAPFILEQLGLPVPKEMQ